MSSAEDFLQICITISLVLLSLSFLVTVVRVIIGPTLADRVLSLDMLVAAAIGFIAVIGIDTGYTLYVDIAISLGLVGFLATVAFARFILHRGEENRMAEDEYAQRKQEEADAARISLGSESQS